MQINLILSLVFGVGQVVAGLFVSRRLLANAPWRRPGSLTLLLLSCWFVASGLCELFVSGMEAAHTLAGAPTLATFEVWRGRADDLLLGVSGALVLLFIGCCLLLRLRGRAARQ